jgi:hypothetical protein
MSSRPTDIVVTPAVRRSKKGKVSRASYGRMEREAFGGPRSPQTWRPFLPTSKCLTRHRDCRGATLHPVT